MISLEKSSGLPLQMKDDYSLEFGDELPIVTPQPREFSSIRNYLKDPSVSFPQKVVYRTYSGLALSEHKEVLQQHKLKYVLFVMPPGKLGEEFVKTRGYYQPQKLGAKTSYPGVYEVVYGKVYWILQSASPDYERLTSAYLVEASRGDKLIVPPGYGIVSVNPTDDVMVIANWRIRGIEGIHEPYEIHNGAAYYVCSSQRLSASGNTSQDVDFLPNLSYNSVPELIKVTPREIPQFELRAALPIYFTGTKNPQSLDFLFNPENYLDTLTPDKLFR